MWRAWVRSILMPPTSLFRIEVTSTYDASVKNLHWVFTAQLVTLVTNSTSAKIMTFFMNSPYPMSHIHTCVKTATFTRRDLQVLGAKEYDFRCPNPKNTPVLQIQHSPNMTELTEVPYWLKVSDKI